MLPDWPPWLWLLYGAGVVHFVLFVVHFFRFRKVAAAAAAGGAEELAAYDRAVRGFPAGFYAKMLGYARRGDPGGPPPGLHAGAGGAGLAAGGTGRGPAPPAAQETVVQVEKGDYQNR